MNFEEENIVLGNDIQKFEKIYEELYKKHNRILEKMRKKLKRIIFIGYVLVIIWVVLSVLFSNQELSVVSGIIMLSLFYIYYDKYESKYIEFYKKEIISKFFSLLNDNLIYVRKKNEIDEIMSEYKLSMFNKVFDTFEANDFVDGYADRDVLVKMCGLHVSIGAGSKKHSFSVNSVFSFTILDKLVKNPIKISTKHKIEKNVIKINNEEFEKIFQVSSTNKETVFPTMVTSEWKHPPTPSTKNFAVQARTSSTCA